MADLLNSRRSFLTAIATSAVIACGGGGSSAPTKVAPAAVVYQSGDSITQQSGQLLAEYLPAGSTVINRGLPGQQAFNMVNGDYGSLPPLVAGAVYTYSFGANECLNGRGVGFYITYLEAAIIYTKGFITVIEAPWQLVNPANQCGDLSPSYQAATASLVNKYSSVAGYKVSMAALDTDRSHDGAGIHLLEPHARLRMSLLGQAIELALVH